ncbi:glycosyl hydrolase family 92-domain-containing protein, partial [Naematelia encephala]
MRLPNVARAVNATSLWQYVNPLVGTSAPSQPGTISGSGNVFPGATVPFGMVKVGIDTAISPELPNNDNINAGYSPAGNVTAISLTHVSGTGGPPKYGVVSQMPLAGSLDGINLADNTTYFQNRSYTDEEATVGYFKTKLLSGVTAEMTATQHAAHLRYTFPSDQAAHILVDLAHVIPGYDQPQEAQRYRGAKMWLGEDGSSYYGSANYAVGWNEAPLWTIYFCGNFSQPADDFGTFGYIYDYITPPSTPPIVRPYYAVSAFDSYGLGSLHTWNNISTLESRVGISYISAEQACAHVAKELPVHRTFEDALGSARAEWEGEVLSSITVPQDYHETNDTLLGLLYTALYGAAVMPTNITGENPLWKSSNPQFTDFYTFWDIYHCTTPLWGLVFTDKWVAMVQSLVDIWKYAGFLPDGRSTFWNGKTQGGSDADNSLADAYIKNVDTNGLVNWEEVYSAMKTNAEVTPFRNLDPDAIDGGTTEGRIALPDWHSLDYISPNYTRSVSRTMEYSQNDFALYQVAKGLGKIEEASLYLKRSQNFRNLYNPNATADLSVIDQGTFTGFFSPKNTDGSWNSTYNITNCGGCSWNDLTYEGLLWEYYFAAPHDVAGLIDLAGGDEAFIKRLDASFINGFFASQASSVGTSNSAGTTIFNPGNEVSFLTPYLYNYVPGNQYKTVQTVRDILGNYYSLDPSGYPGNTDAGAMQSWGLWGLLGLFPVTSQPIYLIGAP